MIDASKFLIGTSGYSFDDWIGPFYPPGTTSRDMFAQYVKRFRMVELNFTFYSMPYPRTLDALAGKSPDNFLFWVKANQEITHKGNLRICREFLEDLSPITTRNKLAGVLLQFPQSFHRTIANRQYLAKLIEAMQPAPLVIEFRHVSWDTASAVAGLRERGVTLVIPDEPDLPGLYRPRPAVTSSIGYLRLHSRDPKKWYAGPADRYDYSYSEQELRELLSHWQNLEQPVDCVNVCFNNCHRGQAAQNAETFRRILGQIERAG